eukprot:TRINITY_DN14455_c2_g1_i1.p1 TRINITY_DN14455_c2_g1~~TRINITY_DN14455_c2_g1_i1.p1  ORF type:complete len:102 (-),score=2.17 TRINITY_DN14455_c2_g1_i1:663-968(-)
MSPALHSFFKTWPVKHPTLPFFQLHAQVSEPPTQDPNKSQRSRRTHSQSDEFHARFIRDVWTVDLTRHSPKTTSPSSSPRHVWLQEQTRSDQVSPRAPHQD